MDACLIFLRKYHLIQKSTFLVVVQYHFEISVLQHWSKTLELFPKKRQSKNQKKTKQKEGEHKKAFIFLVKFY